MYVFAMLVFINTPVASFFQLSHIQNCIRLKILLCYIICFRFKIKYSLRVIFKLCIINSFKNENIFFLFYPFLCLFFLSLNVQILFNLNFKGTSKMFELFKIRFSQNLLIKQNQDCIKLRTI